MILTKDLQSLIFIENNLSKINNIINAKKLIQQLIDVYLTKPIQEKQQILDHLKPNYELVTDKQKRQIIESLLEYLEKGADTEKESSLNLIQSHHELIPTHPQSKRKTFTRLIEAMKLKDAVSFEKLLEIFWNLKHMWEKNKIISSKFKELLEELANDPADNIAGPAKNLLDKFPEQAELFW